MKKKIHTESLFVHFVPIILVPIMIYWLINSIIKNDDIFPTVILTIVIVGLAAQSFIEILYHGIFFDTEKGVIVVKGFTKYYDCRIPVNTLKGVYIKHSAIYVSTKDFDIIFVYKNVTREKKIPFYPTSRRARLFLAKLDYRRVSKIINSWNRYIQENNKSTNSDELIS